MKHQPTLFLMVGYPGSGKTTAANFIHKLTGAIHLWADHERSKMFMEPTYSHHENLQLYAKLNRKAAKLLQAGNSLIFDTNFNFYSDRQNLRKVATEAGAKTVVVWITTDKHVARQRATEHQLAGEHTRVLGNMPLSHFERIAGNLQEPRGSEQPVKLDGTNLTEAAVAGALNIA